MVNLSELSNEMLLKRYFIYETETSKPSRINKIWFEKERDRVKREILFRMVCGRVTGE